MRLDPNCIPEHMMGDKIHVTLNGEPLLRPIVGLDTKEGWVDVPMQGPFTDNRSRNSFLLDQQTMEPLIERLHGTVAITFEKDDLKGINGGMRLVLPPKEQFEHNDKVKDKLRTARHQEVLSQASK